VKDIEDRSTILRSALQMLSSIQQMREKDPDTVEPQACFDCVDFLPVSVEVEKNRQQLEDLSSKISIAYINEVESSGGLDRYC